jgi:hypothetical protein
MVRASQPRAAPTTVPIPPRTVEEPHFVDFDFGCTVPDDFVRSESQSGAWFLSLQ